MLSLDVSMHGILDLKYSMVYGKYNTYKIAYSAVTAYRYPIMFHHWQLNVETIKDKYLKLSFSKQYLLFKAILRKKDESS